MSRIWVAMSGGVDSAVAAHMMLARGDDVTGVTMRLVHAHGLAGDDPIDAAGAVCATLGIPHLVLDARQVFSQRVVLPYLAAYAAGHTPNPCVACNEHVKFAWLLDRAIEGGAEALATGHYARIVRSGQLLRIARAADPTKDQSYFLYALTAGTLERVRFPLGASTKADTRQLAEELGLPVAHRAESQDACFVGTGGTKALVTAAYPATGVPGEIVDSAGVVVGTHTGIAGYTIGQRKGLGIGGLSEPLFVTGIDVSANRVIVGPEAELRVSRVVATNLVPGFDPAEPVEAMVRYRMTPMQASISEAVDRLVVEFDVPVAGVAPGQSVVCYRGDEVVAGGEIVCAS